MSTSQKSSMSSTQGSPNVSVYVDSKSVKMELSIQIYNNKYKCIVWQMQLRRTITYRYP